MVLIKHNYIKSDIFFNPLNYTRFFWVEVFVGPGFSGSGSRIQVFRVQGPVSGFRVQVWVQVQFQGPGPGYRSSQQKRGFS